MDCWAYVDGLNLYNGGAKRCKCKWLDIRALCQLLRPRDTVSRIKYFTALVEKRTFDPGQQHRQEEYWDALETTGVEIIRGRFVQVERYLPLVDSVNMLRGLERNGCKVDGVRPAVVYVYKSEEKHTDVSLAAHLVHDANQSGAGSGFGMAMVITADNDFRDAIRIVRDEVKKPVYIYRPDPRTHCVDLNKAATASRAIVDATYRACLLPDPVIGAAGKPIPKPSSW